MRILKLITALLITCAVPAWAGSSVWEVSNGTQRFFLGGTVHILSAADYPLPPEFEAAFAQADKLVLETNLLQLQDPQFQQTMQREVSYRDGQNLKQYLRPETFKALEDFCAIRGIPVSSLIGFKPGMVSMMLTMIELQRLGLVGIGVDAYFNTRALEENKALGQLETAEQQLGFIAGMGIGQEDALIAYSLRDIDDLAQLMRSIKFVWREGNMPGLEAIALKPLIDDFPAIYESLMLSRNRAWLAQLDAMMQSPEVELILVGVLHLAGEDGLLDQLAAKGYKLRQL